MSDQTTIAVSDGLIALPAIQELAEVYKLSAKAFAFTFRQIAMPQPHTEAEFVSCCLVAKEHGLNPLTKEIYFMRTKAGVIQPIVSVDGWIKKCNEHPQFDGLEFTDERDAGGKLVSMTVCIFRKDRSRPTKVTEYMAECAAAGGPVWRSSPNRMLRNRVLCQGARIAFGFAGIMDRDEFDQWQAMRDVTPAAHRVEVQTAALPLPDIPDIPDSSRAGTIAGNSDGDPHNVPDQEHDAPIADVDGFLAKIEEDISLCESAEELAQIAESNADVVARLPEKARKRVAEMLAEAAE